MAPAGFLGHGKTRSLLLAVVVHVISFGPSGYGAMVGDCGYGLGHVMTVMSLPHVEHSVTWGENTLPHFGQSHPVSILGNILDHARVEHVAVER
jgi:hypothetical protein